MRGLVTLLAVLLLGLAGWFFFGKAAPDALDLASPEVRATGSKAEAEPASLTEPESEPRIETPVAADSELRRSDVPAVDPVLVAAASGPVTITGSVTLLDAQDNRFESEFGSLRILYAGTTLDALDVAVEAGQFSFETDPVADFEIKDIELGGESCGQTMPDQVIEPEEGTHVALTVYKRIPSTLIVRDRVTRQDLSGIELWNRAYWHFSDPDNPSEVSGGERLLENQLSPIRLPVRDGQQAWWVGVRGYAWQRIDFDHRFGGERVVLLDREAAVDVRLVGEVLHQVHAVRLQYTGITFGGGPGLVVKTEGRERVTVGGLRAGSWTVEAIDEAPEDEANVLGKARVEVVAGQTAEVTLELSAQAGPELVHVSGTLELPPEAIRAFRSITWRWKGPSAEEVEDYIVIAQGMFEPVSLAGDVLRWETEEVAPGEWDVEVNPFGHVQRVVVGPAGASGIALRVQSLAEVLVEVRDATTGAHVQTANIEWSRVEGESTHYAGSAEATGDSGMYRILARPGEIQISASASGRSATSQKLTVQAGRNSAAFDLYESLNVVLILKEGTTVVKSDIGWWIGMEAEAVDGEGKVTSYSFDGSAEMTAELSVPGTYRFTFKDVDGYLPVEPIELRLERGETRIEVPLIRE